MTGGDLSSTEDSLASGQDLTFDLPIRTRDTGFSLITRDSGVALAADHLCWTIDGQTFRTPLARIATIHLETSTLSSGVVPVCIVTFDSYAQLKIYGVAADGSPDAQKAALYRDFVVELHRRLAPQDRARIAFTCGYSRSRYARYQIALYVTLAWMVVLPLGLLLYTGKPIVLLLLAGGGVMVWRMQATAAANAPRSYDPFRIPDEMFA